MHSWSASFRALVSLEFGDMARARLVLEFPDAAAAREGGKALKAGLDLARGLYTDLRRELAPIKNAADSESGLVVFLLQQVFDDTPEGRQRLVVEPQTSELHVTVPLRTNAAGERSIVFVAGRVAGKVREAADMAASSNNLKMLALAMHNYNSTYEVFPPHAIYGPDGKALLSWRVAVLPFLEQEELYKQFKLNEPWDSEHNRKLLPKMPKVYALDAAKVAPPGHTFYQVFTGRDTMFPGRTGVRFEDVIDGTDNTLLIVEAGRAVPWTKPEDLAYAPNRPLPPLGGHFPRGWFACYVDGSVRFTPATLDERTVRALITRNGREQIPGAPP